MLTIKVNGYKEAKAILDELPNNMQKKMLLAALRLSAKPALSPSIPECSRLKGAEEYS